MEESVQRIKRPEQVSKQTKKKVLDFYIINNLLCVCVSKTKNERRMGNTLTADDPPIES